MILGKRLLLVAALLGLALLSVGAAARRSNGQLHIRGFFASHVDAERQLEEKFRRIPDSASAEANLRKITSQPHMAGTEGSHQLAEWLRAQYESFGFDAKVVSYSVWLPQPVEVQLELLAPDRQRLATQEEP